MCHGGRGREEVGETPQTAAIHVPHAVYESLLSGLEEHQCVLEKKNKNKSSYNNKRQNVTRQNWNVRIGMWRKVSIIPRPSLAPVCILQVISDPTGAKKGDSKRN